jgi:hypothetical protein
MNLPPSRSESTSADTLRTRGGNASGEEDVLREGGCDSLLLLDPNTPASLDGIGVAGSDVEPPRLSAIAAAAALCSRTAAAAAAEAFAASACASAVAIAFCTVCGTLPDGDARAIAACCSSCSDELLLGDGVLLRPKDEGI